MSHTILFFLMGAISFLVSFFVFPVAITRLKKAKIVGKDMHKPNQPEIAEMGGLVIACGFSAGTIAVIATETFFESILPVNLTQIFAVFSVVLAMTLIGIVDDLIGVRQGIKAILPLIAALPLVAIKAGQTVMKIPVIGSVDFGIFYSLVLVPIGITGAANAFNMLAGFNGLEVGMGIVAMGSLAIVAHSTGAYTSFVLLLIALGALVATLRYNWYPAKVFIGDSGTFSIGAIVASAVILGNFEMAGVIIIIPFVLDFLLKVPYRLPKTFGLYKNGKLYCPKPYPVGLAQLIMKISGGISERKLTLCLIGIEAVCGLTAVLLYTIA